MDETNTPLEQGKAIAAAEAATHTAADLLRFAREGEQPDGLAFDLDTIELGASALKAMIEIELPRLRQKGSDGDGQELLGQLHHALFVFLDGWA